MKKIALQLYSLREFLTADPIGTLKKVHDMGYDGVEWPGVGEKAPEDLEKITSNAGLEFFSVHITADDILTCNLALLRQYAAAGCQFLPIGWLPEERRAGGSLFFQTCDAIQRYATAAKAEGLYVMYHNHEFDLEPIFQNGCRQLDLLYDLLPSSLLGAELDTCWLYTGGVDPAEYIRKYADRSPIVHLKDCVKEGGRAGFCPIGSGVLDFSGIWDACENARWLCVEQDEATPGLDAFQCAQASIQALKQLEAETLNSINK